MRYDLAKESCQKSLQYEPTNSIALLNSATLYSTLKDNAKALKFVDDSITYWNKTKREEMFEFY
jgi:Tfp pilus assembly protein PilF